MNDRGGLIVVCMPHTFTQCQGLVFCLCLTAQCGTAFIWQVPRFSGTCQLTSQFTQTSAAFHMAARVTIDCITDVWSFNLQGSFYSVNSMFLLRNELGNKNGSRTTPDNTVTVVQAIFIYSMFHHVINVCYFTRNPRSYTLSQMYPHVLVSNQSYSYSSQLRRYFRRQLQAPMSGIQATFSQNDIKLFVFCSFRFLLSRLRLIVLSYKFTGFKPQAPVFNRSCPFS